jgi:hypothetical protein
MLFQQVVALVKNAQQQVIRAINSTMVYTYFEIGRMIVEEEQNGKERAAYGKQVLKELSKELTKEFGKGFSVDSLERMRNFYLIYSNSETLSRILDIQKSATLLRNSDNEKTQTLSAKLEKGISQSVIGEFETQKTQTLFSFFKLTWSHYSFLIRIDDENERSFYEIESIKNNWSGGKSLMLSNNYNS